MSEEHLSIVLTNPAEGLEDEYNEWYDNVHLAEVVAVPGFKSARRYKLSPHQYGNTIYGVAGNPDLKHRYLAVYEIEGDVKEAFELLDKEVESGRMVVPECLAPDDVSQTYTAVGEWLRV